METVPPKCSAADGGVAAYCYMTTCVHCDAYSSRRDEFEEQLRREHGVLDIVEWKCDPDSPFRATAAAYGVTGVPGYVLLSSGKVITVPP